MGPLRGAGPTAAQNGRTSPVIKDEVMSDKMPEPPPFIDMGRVNYEAYYKSAGGISRTSGRPLPDWEDVHPDNQEDWKQAGVESVNAWQRHWGLMVEKRKANKEG